MRPALNAGGQVFEQAIDATVPHGATGDLAKSIKRKVSVRGTEGGVTVAGPSYLGGFKHTSQDPGVRGFFLEFGTRKMAPRPFMRKAYDIGKNAAADAVIAVLRALLGQLGK
jgi:HK97 gp10 family phage protein